MNGGERFIGQLRDGVLPSVDSLRSIGIPEGLVNIVEQLGGQLPQRGPGSYSIARTLETLRIRDEQAAAAQLVRKVRFIR